MPEQPVTSELPTPMIHSDTIEHIQSMADGNWYDSRSRLRATYKPSGNPDGKSYVEVGDDSSVVNPKPFQKPKPDRNAIKATVGKAFSQAGLGA